MVASRKNRLTQRMDLFTPVCSRWPLSCRGTIFYTFILLVTLTGCQGQRYLTSISITAPDVTTHTTTHDPSMTTKVIVLGSLPRFNSIEPKEIYTPLQRAVMTDDFDEARILITKGANINEPSSSGKTPLHYAVMTKSFALVELLLKSGARIDLKDAARKTPLDYWESGGNIKLLHLLQSYEEAQSK